MEMKAKFCDRFVEAMEFRKMNREDVFRLTDINPGTLSKYANGVSVPRINKIGALAKALRVNPVWLCGYNCPMIPDDMKEDKEAIVMMLDKMDEVQIKQARQVLEVMFPDKAKKD